MTDTSEFSDRSPISVVVPTRNRSEMLGDCLASLAAALGPDDEVIVVDSASTVPGTAEVVAAHGFRYGRAPEPGASLARNIGIAAATRDVVAFIDDDIRVALDWPAAVVAPFADSAVGFVTGSVEAHDEVERDHPASVITDPEPRVLDRTSTGTMGASANAAARRSALIAIGGFDERLGPGRWINAAEDADLFDRLIAAGWVGRYEPSIRVTHLQWRDRAQTFWVYWAYGKGLGARVAKLYWHDRERAQLLRPEILRLRGVSTAVSDVKEKSRRSWGPPIAWRVGGALGFVVGLAWLRRDVRSTALPAKDSD